MTAPRRLALAGGLAGLHFFVSVCAAGDSAGAPLAGAEQPLIAIIIDDMGYRRAEGLRALELPGALTYACLPHTPWGADFAERARASGREVLLHLPMESQHGLPLGPGGLTASMNETELTASLALAVESIPGASGINNHMGSHLTRQPQPIHWLMAWLAERHGDLFFVDSRTTPGSVILEVAGEYGVSAVARDVFLDHPAGDPAAVHARFEQLVARAHASGTALGIAHPHPATLDALAEALAELHRHRVELVGVSALIEARVGARRQAALQSPRGQAAMIR